MFWISDGPGMEPRVARKNKDSALEPQKPAQASGPSTLKGLDHLHHPVTIARRRAWLGKIHSPAREGEWMRLLLLIRFGCQVCESLYVSESLSLISFQKLLSPCFPGAREKQHAPVPGSFFLSFPGSGHPLCPPHFVARESVSG